MICRAVLSKSLIQFSVYGWSWVSSLLFTWGQTMVEVMKIMVTSLKRSHAVAAMSLRFSCVRPLAALQMAAYQAPLSLGFSRQEHWSGLPFPSPMHESESEVVSDSQRSHGMQPIRLLCPWDFPGKSTGVVCHCLLHKRSHI